MRPLVEVPQLKVYCQPVAASGCEKDKKRYKILCERAGGLQNAKYISHDIFHSKDRITTAFNSVGMLGNTMKCKACLVLAVASASAFVPMSLSR